MTTSVQPAVLLVHGLWDSSARIAPMVQGLHARGVERVHAFDLTPSDGSALIPELARQVQTHADALQPSQRIDVVGFSMGALATRYYLQRCGGRERVRRFISISGPHAGTWTAFALPLAGVRQMRPGSAFLRDLEADANPFGDVEVHCLYTGMDLMIVPATSSILKEARSVHRLPVPLHRWMIRAPIVLDVIVRLLRERATPRAGALHRG